MTGSVEVWRFALDGHKKGVQYNICTTAYLGTRVHFFIGDFGYSGGYFPIAVITIAAVQR